MEFGGALEEVELVVVQSDGGVGDGFVVGLIYFIFLGIEFYFFIDNLENIL